MAFAVEGILSAKTAAEEPELLQGCRFMRTTFICSPKEGLYTPHTYIKDSVLPTGHLQKDF